jgi:hypothetical protein
MISMALRQISDLGYMKMVYLGQMFSKLNRLAYRVENSKALVLLYPSLTSEALQILTKARTFDFIRFACELGREMSLEAVLLPVINNLDEMLDGTKKRNLQLIPVLDLKSEMERFTKQFNQCRSAGSRDIPIIAFKFSSYKNANKAYDLVMDDLDALHEDNQASMMVDIPRFLQSSDCLNVSAPHYSSFFMSDIVAEKYTGQIGMSKSDKEKIGNKRSVRIFCRNDLAISLTGASFLNNNKFDIGTEIHAFNEDKRLYDLFKRLVENTTYDNDWVQNRPTYLSRVHENLRTKEEFETFQKHIDSNSANDYLSIKKDMNTVVSNHLKDKSYSL